MTPSSSSPLRRDGSPGRPASAGGRDGGSPPDVTRALLVRDGPGLKELAEAIRRGSLEHAPRLEEVDDLYEALSELAASHAGSAPPVRAVAVTMRGVLDDASSAREAIRVIDPHVHLVLLSPAGTMNAAAGAGFDQVVPLPAGSAELAAALQIETDSAEGTDTTRIDSDRLGRPSRFPRRRPANGSPDDLASPPDRTMSSLHAAAPEASTARRPTGPGGERDVVEMVIDDAIQAFASRRDGAPPTDQFVDHGVEAAADDPTGSLGDVDLVDAIIEGGDRLTRVALAIVRRELGVADLRFVPAAGDGPDGACGSDEHRATVQAGARTFGELRSREASDASLRPWAEWLAKWMRLDGSHQELRLYAWTDDLTGAGNRRAFERVLEETIAEARRDRRSFSLMFFDIDDFKSYNDRFGHEAGDEVLREVVELLRAVIRRGDHVFRIGGDEFVVIFSDSRAKANVPAGAPLESVATIANRFRDRVCDLKLTQLGLDAVGTLSVSAGVATYPWDGHDAHSLLSHADQLALQSKRSGKNTISFGPGARLGDGGA